MKNSRYQLLAVVALLAAPLSAQETYQDTKLVQSDLNGTARYVGMGGAMEALGADISTITSNPAGIGLFRSSQVTVSGGLVSQSDAETSLSRGGTSISFDGNKTNASFDQVGFVYATPMSRNSYLNFAFNYHKSRNFDQILSAASGLSNASQNKLTSVKYPYGTDYNWNGVDANYSDLMAYTYDDNGRVDGLDYLNGTQYLFGQYQKGYIGTYDFNISGNINDRVFLGITFGMHDVNYRSNSYYAEDLEQDVTADVWEDLRIDGTGFDVKAGVIFRPIESSPFRIGLYVHTPTWYDLTLRGASDITMADADGGVDVGNYCEYDFKVYTPWKFGVSLGHTVGQCLALGATYEFADYNTMDNRVNDGGYYYDSYSDDYMNDNTKMVLKGVHTLKLGAEYKIDNNFAVRVGYNYVSPMFSEDGFRDGSIESAGSAYATSTDYTNWKSTNRVTAGLGYSYKKFFVDLAYQYSQTNGTFYPFMSYYDNSDSTYDNIVDGVDVSNKRHQVLVTLGYKF